MHKITSHRRLNLIFSLCLLIGLLLGTSRAETTKSPLHLSLTEAIYDQGRGRLTINIRVQTADLEATLSARANRTISANDPSELAPLALDYVRETFHLKNAKGEPLRLEWAGLDATSTQIFLFFESSLTGGTQGLRISNTMLHEHFADQINSVELHDGALKQTLVFGHDTGEMMVNAKL
jgi:hypothetical protein